MRLLVTRPEPDNARTAAILRSLGHEVLLAPMLHVEPVPAAELGAGPFAAILITSANAARALAAHPRHGELCSLPVLAVGRSTAEAARAAGFADVISANGDGGDLVRVAADRCRGSRLPLLYAAGEERARDLATELAVQGLDVRTVTVYRAMAASEFPPDVRVALEHGAVDGVLHFSRRSVEAYLACASAIGTAALAPMHCCLSARTAEPLRAAGINRVAIAARPEEAALLALVTSRA